MLVEEAPGLAVGPRAEMPPDARRADVAFEAFELVVVGGDCPGRRIALGAVPGVIGRGVGVDLQIMDPTVSRHHCVVWCIAGRCWVRDLGSTNQTRVNNRCSLVSEIFAGDVLVVGHTTLTLMRAEAGERASAQP